MSPRCITRAVDSLHGRVVLLLWAVAALCPAAAFGQRQTTGEWGELFPLPNVAIHTHVLPNGKVMFWGRREWNPAPDGMPTQGLNPPAPRNITPWLLDPAMKQSVPLKKPGFNVFCSGHTFLPDGRLLVVGGHIEDGKGEPRAAIYDSVADAWEQIPEPPIPNNVAGRWYPSAISLPDGGVLVSFGTNKNGKPNNTQQIWRNNQWTPAQQFNFPVDRAPWYPRMHVVSDGQIFMSGPLPLTQLLNTATGQWSFLRPDPNVDEGVRLSSRESGFRDYAPSVLYDANKILYVGGGIAPTDVAEVVDLSAQPRQWKQTDQMEFPRRQHDATILPDGTVLVTGGTQGDGGESDGFNDLTPGKPIRAAERWDPKTGKWTVLAEAGVDRCYHSTAVLLPDATVLNAGGGEYSPQNNGVPNKRKDTHRRAQIFSPPYLFGPNGQPATRPVITSVPEAVKYQDVFKVETPDPAQVGQVNWVRLSSTTHAFNFNQRINFLKFEVGANGAAFLNVMAPAEPNICPPGHYMLFVLNKANVPSVAKIVRIHP